MLLHDPCATASTLTRGAPGPIGATIGLQVAGRREPMKHLLGAGELEEAALCAACGFAIGDSAGR